MVVRGKIIPTGTTRATTPGIIFGKVKKVRRSLPSTPVASSLGTVNQPYIT